MSQLKLKERPKGSKMIIFYSLIPSSGFKKSEYYSLNSMVKNGTNATPPARKDDVFNCSEQLRLTVHSGAPIQMARSSTVHCQSQLQGTVENRSLLAGGVVFDILRCCKDDHLQTSGYSL